MIAVDSSALVSILEAEADAARFLDVIRMAPRRFASAITVYETGIVIGARRGRESASEILDFIDALGIEIVPFAEPYITLALQAYGRFGKGVDPTARLNLGDCAAYALAMHMDMPLLFKGSDFGATDVRQCL
ncbi:type II toxin-antitoxin system VapC family toxin [Xanthobacteraceae bacterium Astr-EGSB]|uniref:type II toxin-antitoxin system VapC family toxin n=1 Tax=Astrobacterium formosum TaxID=3069710 RepID=UPI0027B1E9FF|nr:type II toxin-antitoxin system VapC family toxin [Xanthobacteraceae bacterium Astr-EGSB]